VNPDRRPLIVAADWSIDPRKRRMCIVRPRAGNAEARNTEDWNADAPCDVGDAATLVARLRAMHPRGPVLLGLDVPIGVPRAYAHAAGLWAIADRDGFRGVLNALGTGERREWFTPTNEPGVHRPFFPARLRERFPGARAHLAAALGLASEADLLRRCDRTGSGRNAQSIFFTCGAAQVGKAAISAWLEVLRPTLDADAATNEGYRVGLWPFDGPLDTLLATCDVVIAEIYPADAGVQLGLCIGGIGASKRDPEHRRSIAGELRSAMRDSGVTPTRALTSAIRDGFASEDDFDAFIAAMAMVRVVSGEHPTGEPREDRAVTACEGWILGRVDGAGPQAAPNPRRMLRTDVPQTRVHRRSGRP